MMYRFRILPHLTESMRTNVADSLSTVRVFEDFARVSPRSRHVSWLDVAKIPWDGNHLWMDHQAYVRQHISSCDKLRAKSKLNRDFADFFGNQAAEEFFAELGRLGVSGTRINLSEFRDDPSFARSFADAFEILLGTAQVSRGVTREDKFADELRRRFLDDLQYHDVHRAVFCLSRRFPYVWVKGKYNYGVKNCTQESPEWSESPDKCRPGVSCGRRKALGTMTEEEAQALCEDLKPGGRE